MIRLATCCVLVVLTRSVQVAMESCSTPLFIKYIGAKTNGSVATAWAEGEVPNAEIEIPTTCLGY